MGTEHILYRVAEVLQVGVVAGLYGFQILQQGGPVVPRGAGGLLYHVVAVEGRQGDALQVGNAQRLQERAILFYDAPEDLLGEVHQVHLVHRQHDVADAKQRHQIAVAAGLGDDSRAGIDQDNGQTGSGAAGNHVTGVLFVSRRVGNDEFPVVGREIAVGHVDGNALFALGFQSIEQQGIVDVFAGIADALAVALQGIQLVFVDFLAVVQQPPDEGGFAVVDRAGCEETQQVFLFVAVEEFFYG